MNYGLEKNNEGSRKILPIAILKQKQNQMKESDHLLQIASVSQQTCA